MNRGDGLIQRRNVVRENSEGVPNKDSQTSDKKHDRGDEDVEDVDSKETRLTLMEEVLLLGLKDKEVDCCSRTFFMCYNVAVVGVHVVLE